VRGAVQRIWQYEVFRWATAAGAALVLLGAAAFLALRLMPDWFASDRFPDRRCVLGERSYKDCLDTAKARADDRRGVTTATLAIFAGALSAFGAFYTARTFRQNRHATEKRHTLDMDVLELNRKSAERTHALDRAGQLTERFTRAVDQLGNAKLAVRLGGIYALERIAKDSKDDHPQVLEVLTAYVREHARWRPNHPEPTHSQPGAPETQRDDQTEALELATDVQAVVSVLGRRTASQDRRGARLNLDGTYLPCLVLLGEEARLENASLIEANLLGASLLVARLQGARLSGANLQGANFFGANLRDAHLSGANLQGANFFAANLQRAHLSGANLQGAHYDAHTTWPEGFDPEAAVVLLGEAPGSFPPPG
jgi:hypothetical protein